MPDSSRLASSKTTMKEEGGLLFGKVTDLLCCCLLLLLAGVNSQSGVQTAHSARFTALLCIPNCINC